MTDAGPLQRTTPENLREDCYMSTPQTGLTRLQAQAAAHESWGRTPDRTARTAPARTAFEARWLKLADGDPLRAESLRAAYFKRLAIKSAKARKRRGPANRGDDRGPR